MTLFNGKSAVVTGAASGIGREVAECYAREGAKVVVADVDEKGGRETVDSIKRKDGQAVFVRTDVSNPRECEAMVNITREQFGGLDMACNNAGIGGEQNPTADHSIEGWQKTIAVNLSGVFYCMKYEIPAMLESESGSIINMASILGRVGFAGAPGYVSAKHGMIGLTQNAAIEYGGQGIRVNSVGPGFIHTPMIEELEEDKETYNTLVSLHPIGRLGKTREVAELVMWLSSDRASFVTGAYYPVDGGYLAR